MDNETYMVLSHDVNLDGNYTEWLRDIKSRYRRSQIKAAVKVNSEKLLFNWQLGRDLVMRKAEEHWGTGIVEQVSLDLQREFPGEGFSALNLWYMKRWYLFYSEKVQQLVGETGNQKLYQLGKEIQLFDKQSKKTLYQLGKVLTETPEEGLPFPPVFGFVPWRHHTEIISKCHTLDQALFYLHQTIAEGWSRDTLIRQIKSDLYSKQGKAITNFTEWLPETQATIAQEITKENYDFGFVTLPKDYDEKQLEDALCEQLTQFLLELGTGFAFVGRQKEIVVAGKTRRIDLLFYHIKLRCYIVCDLKAKPFEPEYAGKINFYVNAVDDLFKSDADNPTIGLLICSDMNTTEVQYAFRGINTPLGVAAYKNIQEVQKLLPTVEQLKERIKMLENDLKEKMG